MDLANVGDAISVRVAVHAIEDISWGELAPLLDTLDSRGLYVQPTRFTPPAAGGGPDVALTIIIHVEPWMVATSALGLAATAALRTFINGFVNKAGEDAFDATRRAAYMLRSYAVGPAVEASV